MQKILLALSPSNMNREVIDFSCYLSKLAHTRITGVFLGAPHTAETVKRSLQMEHQRSVAHLAPDNNSLLAYAMVHFKEACICRDTDYLLHGDRCVTAEELVEESRFSDLMILPPGLSYNQDIETAPSALARAILTRAECPVILAPEAFDGIHEVVYTYNGNSASVYAIKQFTYLFPEFTKSNITILAVNSGHTGFPDEPALMEWIESHYTRVTYKSLSGDPVDQLILYLLSRRNALVVMGAYGRSAFSRLIRKSTADPLSGTLLHPIFIAH
ncbi:universal stress protein [Taibaiella helva]|uniref:universal stress protein n=1 Tax=Taibaiella helva TaxID=2301235 RepID=UPI0013007A5E|nr:universal stress protein [Taibaiella helva]